MKTLLSIALIFSSVALSAQAFTATYDFAATTSVTGTTDPTTPPSVTGITFGSFTAVGTPSANPNAAARFSFVGWPGGATNGNDTYSTFTGSANTGEYYEVILTPQAGYTVALNTITFGVRRSGTGIRNYSVRTSADGFTNNLPASVVASPSLSVVGVNEFFWAYDAASTSVDLNGSTITLFGATSTTATSFRFYGWNSEAAGGTFSIDNVVFSGSVTAAASCTAPAITSITGNSPICSNQPLQLNSTVTGSGPITYAWAGSGSFSSTSVANPTVTGSSAGGYTLTASNTCGTVSAVYNATVTPTPTISVNAASICSGGAATLTATGATTYTWNTGATTNTISVSPTSTTAYTVTGANGSCSSVATTTVTVIASPTLAVNSVSICAGATATLTATGLSTYTWTSPVSNNASISVSPAATTVYSVSGNAAGCAGTFSATGTVSVNPLPTLTVSPTSPTICAGQAATLTVTGVTSQTWTPGSQTTPSISVTPTTTTTYTVFGTNSGCGNTQTVTVNVNPLPTLTANSASVCTGKTTILTASGTSATYSWSPSGVTTNTILVSAANAGLFTFTITGTSALGCSKSITANLVGIATPTINITATQSVICIGQPVTLTASGASTYAWTGGVTNGTAFSPTTTATYTVTGTSAIGSCTATAAKTVSVSPCTGIQENVATAGFAVYPNPNNGSFTVQSSVFPATLVMYDVTGRQVIRKDITELETAVNASQLNNGVYYISLNAASGSMNYKIVISK